MDKLLVIGDTHCDFGYILDSVAVHCENIDKDDIINAVLIAGDCGFWPGDTIGNKFLKNIADFTLPVYFIDGNHEQHERLQQAIQYNDNDICEISKNLYYIKRGKVVTINGIKIGCLGGGVSIDKHVRTTGIDFFDCEVPSYEEFQSFIDVVQMHKPDYIVTHDAPFSAIVHSGICPRVREDESNRGFDNVFNAIKDCDFKCWIFGHYHSSKSFEYKNKKFRALCGDAPNANSDSDFGIIL